MTGAPATVSRVLRRLGLNRLKALDPAPPIRRYERDNPGELLHIDIKKLGRFERPGHSNSRGVGWEYVHVCVDDASRVAFVRILPDEKKHGAVTFLNAAVAYHQGLGISVERVMTDNGWCYKSHDFRDACKDLGSKHIRTRPYTPKTNRKAEPEGINIPFVMHDDPETHEFRRHALLNGQDEIDLVLEQEDKIEAFEASLGPHGGMLSVGRKA